MHAKDNSFFLCRKCDRQRPVSLYSAPRNRCRICEHYRPRIHGEFADFEAKTIALRAQREAGIKPCCKCNSVFNRSELKRRSTMCPACYAEEKRNQRRAKAERDGKLYIPGGTAGIQSYWQAVKTDAHVGAYKKHLKQVANDNKPRKPWNEPGLSNAEKFAIRYRADKEYHVKQRFRLQFRKHMVRGAKHIMGIPTPHRRYSFKMDELLGYTANEFVTHIERMFSDGMTWQSFFSGKIHIDHIRPISSFNLDDPDQLAACFALSNLQPLWAKDNIRKSDKMTSGVRGRHVRGMAA